MATQRRRAAAESPRPKSPRSPRALSPLSPRAGKSTGRPAPIAAVVAAADAVPRTRRKKTLTGKAFSSDSDGDGTAMTHHGGLATVADKGNVGRVAGKELFAGPSVLSGAMILAGTAVGAGMFAMPIEAAGMWSVARRHGPHVIATCGPLLADSLAHLLTHLLAHLTNSRTPSFFQVQ
jgi:hypothetical protein